jgi:hypothetical protein
MINDIRSLIDEEVRTCEVCCDNLTTREITFSADVPSSPAVEMPKGITTILLRFSYSKYFLFFSNSALVAAPHFSMSFRWEVL